MAGRGGGGAWRARFDTVSTRRAVGPCRVHTVCWLAVGWLAGFFPRTGLAIITFTVAGAFPSTEYKEKSLPLSLVMALPLAWQGDGPPQPLSVPSSTHCGDQFDTSQSLASLTFIAAQLSALLHTVSLASSATTPSGSNPYPTASLPTFPHSPSSVLLSLSNPLTLCHSNLLAALSHVVSTSFHLVNLPTHSTPREPHLPSVPNPTTIPTSPSAPAPTTPSITVPPRFTIRVVTDLEPVTPPTSRPHSPSTPTPSSSTHHLRLPRPTATVHSDAPTVDQNDIVVKATLHPVSATAISPVYTVQPSVHTNDDNECSSPDALPATSLTKTDTSIHLSTSPTTSTDPVTSIPCR